MAERRSSLRQASLRARYSILLRILGGVSSTLGWATSVAGLVVM